MLFISMTLLRAMNGSGAGRHGWAPMACMAVATAVCVCARACVCARMLACVRV